MHVHELNPKRTAVTLVLFAIVIVVGLFTMANPRLKYAQTPGETLKMLRNDAGLFFPHQLVGVLEGNNDTVMLIDLRNAFEFGRGSIQHAENISAVELLSEENIDRLEQLKSNGITVVVFADNQLEANGPWMLLRQLGFDNIMVLAGGYDYYKKRQGNLSGTAENDTYLLGTADYNFAEIASGTIAAGKSEDASKSGLSIKRKRKPAVAEGGC
ncbi:MAG: rhodanese-like domain-containing protein [Bacteroidales bacterium]|nr:rhodanese-like domain-containing protein [Bacteroidales bacterium]